MLNDIRQLIYPREFRIGRPVWDQSWRKDFQDCIDKLRPIAKEGAGGGLQEELQFLADVVTDIWRTRQKMLVPGSGEPIEEMRKPFRHVEAVWDIFLQSGFKIIDHLGEKIPETGIYQLKILAIQPDPDVDCETVVETIKPTIYFNNEMIQLGEVIVARPETEEEEAEDEQAPPG